MNKTAPGFSGSEIAAEGLAPSAKLEIRLLGELSVVSCGREVRLPSRRAGWLLAILALRRGRPIERQTLAGLLWPDSSDGGALHNLRQTLALLRTSLGPAGKLLATVSPRSILLQPTPEVWVDAHEFDEAAAEGSSPALERAVELYRGPLFAGCDEPFALLERDERQRAFIGVVERLAAHHALLHDHSKAAEVLRRAAAEDPYRESIVRALMNSLALSGEAAAAIDLYRNFRRTLRQDLNAEPDPETANLYRSIRHELTTPTTTKRPSSVREKRLPSPLSSLRGRTSEIREVAALLERCRLVTMTGIGGIGKTRLAIAVSRAVEDRFLDGVRFVDLSPIQGSAVVPMAIAAALDIPDAAGGQVLESLATRVRDRDLLIVVDNCEHLLEGVTPTLEVLLSAAPGLHVLATSRQSVGVVGEYVWRVPSLSTPEACSLAEDLMKSDSVQLFLDRSGQTGDSANPTPSELELIGSICRRLDGIPLAIELAAARTRVLSIGEIEARLEDRFGILAGGCASLPRHQTLQAAFEWSWDLLGDAERGLLQSLSVFRGGWTLEAAESVGSREPNSASVLETLASLVDRSLVISSRADGVARFSMLESTRQFALDRLCESGDINAASDRHRDHFLSSAEEIRVKLDSGDQNRWFRNLESEHDNLRAALDWCHARQDGEKALRLAVALARFWDTHGHVSDGRARLEAAMALATGAPTALMAEAHVHAGWMATLQRDGFASYEHYKVALPYFREVGDERRLALVLNASGTASRLSGNCEAAKRYFEEALVVHRRRGSKDGVACVLSNLGALALHMKDCGAARSYLDQSLAESTRISELLGLTHCNLAMADVFENRFGEARPHVIQGLRIFRDTAAVVSIPATLELLAVIVAHFEEWERAAHLFGASEGLAASQGIPTEDLVAEERDAATALTREALGQEDFRRTFVAGTQLSADEALAYALSGEPEVAFETAVSII